MPQKIPHEALWSLAWSVLQKRSAEAHSCSDAAASLSFHGMRGTNSKMQEINTTNEQKMYPSSHPSMAAIKATTSAQRSQRGREPHGTRYSEEGKAAIAAMNRFAPRNSHFARDILVCSTCSMVEWCELVNTRDARNPAIPHTSPAKTLTIRGRSAS